MTKRLEALNKARDKIDFWGNSHPKCPHCGSDFDIESNDAYSLYDDSNTHDVECPDCGLEYTVEVRCSYTFSTDEQEESEEDFDANSEEPA